MSATKRAEIRKQASSVHRKQINFDQIADNSKKEVGHDCLLQMDKSLPPAGSQSWLRLVVFKAAVNGDVDQLSSALAKCPNVKELVNYEDLSGFTCLHLAARFNHVEVAEILLTHGADVNRVASLSSTPLQLACRFQHHKMAELLLMYGACPKMSTPYGGNVLHTIAMYATDSLAETVFSKVKKPPVNETDQLGMTPLHVAAQTGRPDVCSWLLKHGADPRVQDLRQTTPLMAAGRCGEVEVIRTLLLSEPYFAHKASRIQQDVDDEGNGALHHAVNGGHYKAVQELLIWGASANCLNKQSMTPLHLCAEHNRADLVPLLIAYKADWTLRDFKGRTPLHRAVELRNMAIITALLTQGADANVQDAHYRTPLLLACSLGYTEAIRLLADSGCDLTLTDFFGRSCLHYVLEAASRDCLDVLLEIRLDKRADVLNLSDLFGETPLHVAAKQKNPELVDALLAAGCCPVVKDATGKLPLHSAASCGTYQTILTLANVTPEIDTQCHEGKSPFLLACQSGNRGAVSALLKSGANIQLTDFHYGTALMAAAKGGYTDLVEDLVARGVPVNNKDKERNTALHYACQHGSLPTVKMFLGLGASVAETNLLGETPLDLAVNMSRSEVAAALMDHDSWEEGLTGATAHKTHSTLYRMIENTPSAVKIVLDKCVKTSDHAPTDEAYAVEFDYKYVNMGQNAIKDSIFVAMLDNSREDLLSHPLIQSNLSYKWYTTGNMVFYLQSLIQLCYLLAVITYYMIMPKPHQQFYPCPGDASNYSNFTFLDNITEPDKTAGYWTSGANISETLIYTFMGLQSVLDFYMCLVVGRTLLRSMNVMLSFVISGLILYATTPSGKVPCDNQWRALSYALFLFFMKTSLLCQRLDSIGIYFTMFAEVGKTILKVSFLLVFFIFAIAVPYSVMIKQIGFENVGTSLLSTFAMSLGEFNFVDNFMDQANQPFQADLFLFFPVGCLIINFCLMNLMIGVAVGDISKVEKKAYLTRLRTHVNYLLFTDKVLAPIWRHFSDNTKLVIRPNAKARSFRDKIKKILVNCKQISFLEKSKDSIPQEDELAALRKEIAAQRLQMEKLRQAAEDTITVLNRLCQERGETVQSLSRQATSQTNGNCT